MLFCSILLIINFAHTSANSRQNFCLYKEDGYYETNRCANVFVKCSQSQTQFYECQNFQVFKHGRCISREECVEQSDEIFPREEPDFNRFPQPQPPPHRHEQQDNEIFGRFEPFQRQNPENFCIGKPDGRYIILVFT